MGLIVFLRPGNLTNCASYDTLAKLAMRTGVYKVLESIRQRGLGGVYKVLEGIREVL